MSLVVLFPYPIKRNISTGNGVTKILQKKLLYIELLSDICNATKKIPRKFQFHRYNVKGVSLKIRCVIVVHKTNVRMIFALKSVFINTLTYCSITAF